VPARRDPGRIEWNPVAVSFTVRWQRGRQSTWIVRGGPASPSSWPRCGPKALAPFTITLGPARVDPEALMLPVHPAQPVARLRAAIADVWGPDNVPEDADGFRPHVSLAYSNAVGPAELIIQ
jgi:hypothetical protein